MISVASKLLLPVWPDTKILLIAVLAFLPRTAIAEPFPLGKSQQNALLPTLSLSVDIFRPTHCTERSILLVFAGKSRNSDTYRDDSIPLARTTCSIVIAPHFDRDRFPNWQYQRGGIPQRPGEPAAISLVEPLINWAQHETGNTTAPIILIGHSAGAQFLGRVAAYTQTDASTIVIMNPSTYVLPDMKTAAPYGFRNFCVEGAKKCLGPYLQTKLNFLLGADDDDTSHDLVQTPEAMQQGANRLERGQRTFQLGQKTASLLHIPLGWSLQIVPDTGHNGRKMMASSQLRETINTIITHASSR